MYVLILLCKLALTCELHLFKDFHELLAFILKSEFCLLFLLLLLKQSFVCGFLVCYSEHNVLERKFNTFYFLHFLYKNILCFVIRNLQYVILQIWFQSNIANMHTCKCLIRPQINVEVILPTILNKYKCLYLELYVK